MPTVLTPNDCIWRCILTCLRIGIILADVGFKEMMLDFMHQYVCPLAAILFPEHGGTSLDKLHSFVVSLALVMMKVSPPESLFMLRKVKYKIGEDLDLKEHVDDSEVTLNVSLGKAFTGMFQQLTIPSPPCALTLKRQEETWSSTE